MAQLSSRSNNSDRKKIIAGTYFNCIMFMVASSVVSTILILNYHHRNADTHEMSEWVTLSRFFASNIFIIQSCSLPSDDFRFEWYFCIGCHACCGCQGPDKSPVASAIRQALTLLPKRSR